MRPWQVKRRASPFGRNAEAPLYVDMSCMASGGPVFAVSSRLGPSPQLKGHRRAPSHWLHGWDDRPDGYNAPRCFPIGDEMIKACLHPDN